MWHTESIAVVGNGVATVYDGAMMYSHWAHQVAAYANGDSFTNAFYIAAGTYTLYVLGATFTDRGRLDWYIDDKATPDIALQDWNAGFAYNVLRTGTIVVPTDGYHKLTAVVNGTTSGNWHIVLTQFWVEPASD